MYSRHKTLFLHTRGAAFARKAILYRRADLGEDICDTAKNLSKFQVEKLTWYFDTFFDLEKDGKIEFVDIIKLNERMRDYAGWTDEREEYKVLCDLNRNFFECLIDQVERENLQYGRECEKVSSVTLNQWLNLWGRMIVGATSMADFPIWVQLLPQMVYLVMDRDKDNEIIKEELRLYYKDFIGIPTAQLEDVTNEGYRSMTANGDYKLTMENYEMSFANFLLGKTIYGPGKYVFGCFDNRELNEPFKVQYNEEDEE